MSRPVRGALRFRLCVAVLALGCGGRTPAAPSSSGSAPVGSGSASGIPAGSGSVKASAGVISGALSGANGSSNYGGSSTGAPCQCTDSACFCPNYCPVGCGPEQTCQSGNCVPLADASTDATTGEAGEDASTGTPPSCAPGGPGNSIAFDLRTDATGPVYYGGAQGEGWLDSFGCASWLAIAPADEPALNLVKGGCAISCLAFAPEPATAQSFTWDGTYYPNVAVPCTGIACACQTPVCAPPGNYVATICVGYGEADAGRPETAPPTCKQVPFAWPPTSANQSIVESITPTPDGG
jgi:hypothetical protein